MMCSYTYVLTKAIAQLCIKMQHKGAYQGTNTAKAVLCAVFIPRYPLHYYTHKALTGIL